MKKSEFKRKYNFNIYFCKWDNIYSKIIRFGTGAEFSHVGIGFEDYKNENYIYESLNVGFYGFPYSDLRSNDKVEIITLEKNISQNRKKELEDEIKKYVGRPYDWSNIFMIALNLILPTNFLLKFETPRQLICSEAVALAFKDIYKIDLSKVFNKDEGYITPQELYDYFVNIKTKGL